MAAPSCYKKVADLLDRFSEGPLPPLLKKVDVAHARGDSLTIKTPPVQKRKWVVWLANHVDRKDDEWQSTWAKTAEEAKSNVQGIIDTSRFSVGRVYTIKEFRRFHGNWPV